MPCLKYICVPDRSRAMFFMSGTTRGAWEFVATSVDICLRHYTQRRLGGKKRKTQSLATKRQSKLLTGSHGNRGETDKGLPRKAAFRLQRKTLRFNLTRLSLAVSPVITGRWCRGMNNDLWEESLKVVFHGTSMATGTYVRCLWSKKETKNWNEEAIFRACLKRQEEENSDNASLPSARGHVDKLLFPRQMEGEQKVTLIERNSSVCAQKTEYLFWLH